MKKPKVIEDYYILIYKPSHQRAMEGYVPEHILVAEKELGRSLTADEDVRHINGNTQDNRSSNLEVVSINADYRVQGFSYEPNDRKTNRTYIPCRFQRECWRTIRAPIARAKKVYIPYICSYQEMGDIYKCGHFWNFIDREFSENDTTNSK